MSVSRLILCLAAAVLMAAAPVAHHLERARLCHGALDFECAEAELRAARLGVAEANQATPDQTAAAVWRLSAEVALAQGRDAEARDYLVALLAVRPGFLPPAGSWPPSWLAVLEQARGQAPDKVEPTLTVAPPASPRAGEAMNIQVIAEDPGGVSRVLLSVMGPQMTEPVTIAMVSPDGRRFTATVPAELVQPPELGLWVRAWDGLGNGPARWGSIDSPTRVTVKRAAVVEAPSTPLVQRWWFWTGIGVVVVGGAIAALALSGGDSDPSTKGAESGDARVVVHLP